MIIFSILSIIIMVIFSYYSETIPELLLLSVILLSYRKDIPSHRLKIYSLLAGYTSDVFFYSNYPIYTLTYFIISLITNTHLKNFIVFDFINLLRITFIFVFSEKLIFVLFNLSLDSNLLVYRNIGSAIFEIIALIFFLMIYYHLNRFLNKKSLYNT